MGAREDWNIDRYLADIRLVQTDAKVALSAQKKQDEDADVYETSLGFKNNQN